MTVYVDDMYLYPMGRFGRMKMSHLVADDEEELHAMAARIGVARRWYQGDHYDIAQTKRAEALALGAVAVTLRQLSAMCMLRRVTGALGDPATALERMSALFEERRNGRKTQIAD